jgi:hypothetical protein
MSDEADLGSDRELEDTAKAIAAARIGADAASEGSSGECSWCGYVKERLIGGACAPCRDEFKLD